MTDNSPQTFAPIVGSRACEEVVEQISHAILNGRFRVGDRLPTVEALAASMHVSKPTVGEAVRILVDAGVLSTRRGATGGIVVETATIPPFALRLSSHPRGTTLAELAEARRPIEIQLVRLAAVRAGKQDLEELRLANQLLEQSRGKPEQWAQANNMFHYAIAQAAGNPLLAEFLHEILVEMTLLVDNWGERYVNPDGTLSEHADTLRAIESGEPDLAEKAMDEHLLEMERLAAQQEEASPAALHE